MGKEFRPVDTIYCHGRKVQNIMQQGRQIGDKDVDAGKQVSDHEDIYVSH